MTWGEKEGEDGSTPNRLSTIFSLSLLVIAIDDWSSFCISCMRRDIELSSSDMLTSGSIVPSSPSLSRLVCRVGVGKAIERRRICTTFHSSDDGGDDDAMVSGC